SATARRSRLPATLWIGLAWIALCEILLFTDVLLSGRGAVRDPATMSAVLAQAPTTVLETIARFVAINMTPLVWVGYILLLEGVLTLQTGASPVRRRPHHFALLALASVFIWCVFDAINFNRGMRAWHYLGMPDAY